MKKLMKTVAASAVALVASGAFADLPSPAAPLSFDALADGTKTVAQFVSMADDGNTEGSKYWFAITNNNQEASAELVTVTNDVEQGNYISIEAGAPLYRTINAVSDGYGATFDEARAAAETIGSDGIYLDTMVKFTVSSDDTFGDLDSVNDKLAITCYSAEDSNVTNLLVRAGYVVGSTATPTNYYLNLPEGFNVDEWHRLTVRAITVGNSVGFAIYLDGDANNHDPLAYNDPEKAGDDNYVASLTGVASSYLYTENFHALLPSLIMTGSDKQKLSAVGFKGTGSVDDIQFTGTKPSFITEDITVKINWTEGVASFTVTDNNNNTITNADNLTGEGFAEFKLDPTTVSNLTVIASYATGYEPGTWTSDPVEALSGSTFTVSDGAELDIVAMEPKFEVNGAHYGSFEDALAEAAGTDEASMGTIKLLADVTGDNEVSGWVTIDLAGKKLIGVTDGAIINDGAHLFITNSTVEIGHVQVGTATQAVLLTGGYTTIYAGWFDGEVFEDGADELSLYGGYYLDINDATTVEDFYLEDYAKDTVTYTGSDYYFQVGGAEPTPTEPTIDPTDTDPTAEVEATDEEEAIEKVKLDTPAEAESEAQYKALFDFSATETSVGSGVYIVALEGIKESVELAVEESAMDVLDGKLGAKVQVPAGLNYKITTYETLGGSAAETKSGLSNGTGVSVSKPGTTQGFIKIEMATVPFN